MDITTEYERLCALTATEEGWKLVNDAWNHAMGDGKNRGSLFSAGAGVTGFAIDYETKHCVLDQDSRDHLWAREQVVQWLQDEHGESFDGALARTIRGWGGRILDFTFPCIFMGSRRFNGANGKSLVEELDQAILSQGIGLPITGMYLQRIKTRILG
jgi:hypothetical protein